MTADGRAPGDIGTGARITSRHGRGPLPWPLGALAQPVYRAIINSRNRQFDRGRGVVRFDRVVISVGNLSVGGTGKTPMVAQIVRWLLESEHRPVIAMRGYGAGKGGADESDEAAAYRREFPDLPIVARANRIFGLIQHFGREYDAQAADLEEGTSAPRAAEPSRHDETDDTFEHDPDADHPPEPTEPPEPPDLAEGLELARAHPTGHHSDCIILDDGFQHRQIARDLDIVLIDATRNPFEDRLLPAGWLREPAASLKRASLIVLTHAESVAQADLTTIDRQIAELRGRGADAVSRHDWHTLTIVEGDQERAEHPSWISDRRVFAVSAIGNPAPFLQQVQRTTGMPLAGELTLRDHDPYAGPTIRRLMDQARASGAQAIITTEKDWSKLARIRPDAWPCPVVRVRLQMGFQRGGEELRNRILSTVAAGAPE